LWCQLHKSKVDLEHIDSLKRLIGYKRPGIVKNLEQIRHVQFNYGEFSESTPSTEHLTFIIKEGKLELIEYDCDNINHEEQPFTLFMEMLFDLDTFTLNDEFIKRIFGVAGGVELLYTRFREVVATREEYDRNVAVPDKKRYRNY
jgi:hypothetical protein